ncbi:MAG: hypothetical protein IJ400_04950 [Clostridia bacterium]|nr:hypothetical protein [Clostridia bacterium]
MKVRNRVISFVMLCVMLFAMVIPTNATDSGIMPCYNNTNSTYANFAIDDSGIATTAYLCDGYNNVTTTIKVEIQLQKKTWWWYNNVDGAYWKDVVDYYHCSGEHSIQLTQGGTYKSVVTFTVYGCGGVADVITSEIELSY